MRRSRIDLLRLYNIINKGVCRDQHQWIFRFYAWLPAEKVTKGYANGLLSFYPTATQIEFYWLSGLEKFATHIPGFFPKLIGQLFDRRKKDAEFSFTLPHDFFANHSRDFKKAGTLTRAVYLQQAEMDDQYDQLGTELCCLLPVAPSLLDDLIKQKRTGDPIKTVSIKDLTGVWQLENGEAYILSALRLIGENPGHFSMQDFGKSFFMTLNDATLKKAKRFCRKFIDGFRNDVPQLNQLLRIARQCLSEFYPELICHLVQTNDDLQLFRDLQLLNNHFSSSSREDIWADHRVLEYQELLTAIRKLPDNFKYSGQIVYLREQIAREQRMAAQERKSRALFNYW